MKKVLSLLIVVILVLGMSTMAFASGSAPTTGTITITPPTGIDPTGANSYKIYKVFDATVNATDNTKVNYTLCSGDSLSAAMTAAGFFIDDGGNVHYGTFTESATGSYMVGGKKGTITENTTLTDAAIAAIGAYVTESDLVDTATSTGSAAATSNPLPFGFYYITTTTGTVVTIDSNNNNPTVEDKNTVPSVDKTITGASSYDTDGKKALAQVGTEVEYTAEITVGKGQLNYKFEDTLGTGVEYVANSLSVTGMTAGTDYTLAVSGQNITVTFENDSIKDLAEGAKITVTYKAKVTSDALQDSPAENTATISYGHNSQYTSEPSKADVYNAKFEITKKDGAGAALAGAGFVIKNSDNKYYKLDNGAVTWVDSIDAADEHTSGSDGKVPAFTGLANGTYTVIEKTTPTGYNTAADSTFTIAEHDYTAANLKQEADVVNNAGSELPSTGGIGTTLFYVIGAILVLGAGVVLVTRRKLGTR